MKDIYQYILSKLYRLERLAQTKTSVGTPCSIELVNTLPTVLAPILASAPIINRF